MFFNVVPQSNIERHDARPKLGSFTMHAPTAHWEDRRGSIVTRPILLRASDYQATLQLEVGLMKQHSDHSCRWLQQPDPCSDTDKAQLLLAGCARQHS